MSRSDIHLRKDNAVRLSDLVSMVPFGVGVFLMGGGCGFALKLAYVQFKSGHVIDQVNDFNLWITLLLGTLSYCFNFCFGCAMGMVNVRHQLLGERPRGIWRLPAFFGISLELLILLGWLVLFNAPLWLYRLIEINSWHYISGSYYQDLPMSLANDLLLYFDMGNFALLGSFLFAVSLGKFWNRVFAFRPSEELAE
jgi:hypothetical protein